MVTKECITLYNKLNIFVKKVINRDVQPQIDDLESDVTSLNTSITNIMGFTLVHSGASNSINVYSNGLLVYLTIQGVFNMSPNRDTNTGVIPNQYAPNMPITVATHPSSNNKLAIQVDGTLIYHNFTSETRVTLRVGVVYPLKASLP